MQIHMYHATAKTDSLQTVCDAVRQLKPYIEERFVKADPTFSLSVFLYEKQLYFYVESQNAVLPQIVFETLAPYLEQQTQAGGGYFHEIPCVFHFNEPQSEQHWKRKTRPWDTFLMVSKLDPRYVSRYIFYHYQFQEETPGVGDKYGRIFLHDTLAVYYGEMPECMEPAPFAGSLSTHNTPEDSEWQSIMETHFLPWEKAYEPIDIHAYDWENQGYPEGKTNNQWLYVKKLLSFVQ